MSNADLPATATSEPPSVRSTTTVAAIFIAVFLLSAGSALQNSAVVLRAGVEGFGDLAIGLMMSAFYAGFVLGNLVAPGALKGVGYVRTFAGFASIASAASLAHLLVLHPTVWIVIRLIHGVCTACMLVVTEEWLTTSSPTASRKRILGLYAIVYILSLGALQPLLGWFGADGFRLFLIIGIIISLSVIPVAVHDIRREDRASFDLERLPPGSAFQISPLASSGILLSGIMTSALWSLGPRYASFAGLDNLATGLFMLSISLGAIVVIIPLGAISDRFDRRSVILFTSMLGFAVSLVFLAGGRLSESTLVFLAALAGATSMPVYSLCVAQIHDQIESENLVRRAFGLMIFFSLGAVAGPLVASLMFPLFGASALFVTIGLAQLGLLLANLRGLRRIPSVERARKIAFNPYPHTTPKALILARRIVERSRHRTPPSTA